MSSKPAASLGGGREPLIDESLDISRLLLDFLNAAYAARNEAGHDEDRGGERRPGLSPHAIRAAIHIHRQGEQSIGQLASGLGISYGWASRVVDELEASKFVLRERDGRDHRVVRIRLDPAAVRSIERAYRWREQDVLEALRPLSPGDREAVRRFLTSITDRLRASGTDRSDNAPRA